MLTLPPGITPAAPPPPGPGPQRPAPVGAAEAAAPIAAVAVHGETGMPPAPPVRTAPAEGTRIAGEQARAPLLSPALLEEAVLRAAEAAPGVGGAPRAAQLSAHLQLLGAWLDALVEGAADGSAAARPPLSWPDASVPIAQDPRAAWTQLRERLASSPLFAAHRAGPGGSPDAASDGFRPAAQAYAQAARALPAQSVQGTSADVVAPALQLLLDGRLAWQGELTPGVRASLQREDAWEEDPQHPGRLRRGTALRLDLVLPSGDALGLRATQVAERMQVVLAPASGREARYAEALPRLRAALAAAGSAAAVRLAGEEPGP